MEGFSATHNTLMVELDRDSVFRTLTEVTGRALAIRHGGQN